jgi:Bardet-Biedl syndrome 9 protein
MIVHELVTRLKHNFDGLKDGVPLRLSFMGPIPLQYYFELIDNHFEVCHHLSLHIILLALPVTW